MTLSAVTTAQPVDGGARTWWLAVRSPSAVHWWRRAAAVVLVQHYGRALFDLPPWLTDGRHVVADELLEVVRHSRMASGFPFSASEPTIAAGVVFALASLFGVIPRVAAVVLYVVGLSIYWAILPVATFDDYSAIAGAFVLAVAPTGRSWHGRRATNPSQHVRNSPVPALAVTAALVCVLLVYICGGPVETAMLGSSESVVVRGAFRVLAVALVAPSAPIQGMATVLQIALHGYLIGKTQLVTTNLMLASTCLLFHGDPPPERRPTWVVDTGAVVAFVAVAVAATAVVGTVLRPGQPSLALRIALDAAYVPAHALIPRQQPAAVVVWTIDGAGVVRRTTSGDADPRTRTVLATLESINPGGPLARELARTIAQRSCGRTMGSPRIQSGSIWSEALEGSVMPDFTCNGRVKGSVAER